MELSNTSAYIRQVLGSISSTSKKKKVRYYIQNIKENKHQKMIENWDILH